MTALGQMLSQILGQVRGKARRPVAYAALSVLAGACAHLLGIRPDGPGAFEHRAHVKEGISCVSCHSAVAQTTRQSPLDLPGTDNCVSCHEEPHDPRTCGQCHGSERTRSATLQAKEHLRFDHKQHVEASRGQCVRCHHEVAHPGAPLRPTMASCFGCHEHQEQWATRDCGACHRDMEGELTRPGSHVVHGDNFIDGHAIQAAAARDLCTSCHAESMCAACHGASVAALPSTFDFDRPHKASMHGAGFASRHSLEARSDPALCVTCHAESSCRSCHRDKGLLTATAERGAPHPPGWVGTRGAENLHGREARRDPISCASCHGGAGEQLCVGCHRVGAPGGNPHPPGFSSRKPQSELPCRLCHTEAG